MAPSALSSRFISAEKKNKLGVGVAGRQGYKYVGVKLKWLVCFFLLRWLFFFQLLSMELNVLRAKSLCAFSLAMGLFST